MTMRYLFADSIGAHAMRFEKPLVATYGDDAGARMLAAFLIVGIAMPAPATCGFRRRCTACGRRT